MNIILLFLEISKEFFDSVYSPFYNEEEEEEEEEDE